MPALAPLQATPPVPAQGLWLPEEKALEGAPSLAGCCGQPSAKPPASARFSSPAGVTGQPPPSRVKPRHANPLLLLKCRFSPPLLSSQGHAGHTVHRSGAKRSWRRAAGCCLSCHPAGSNSDLAGGKGCMHGEGAWSLHAFLQREGRSICLQKIPLAGRRGCTLWLLQAAEQQLATVGGNRDCSGAGGKKDFNPRIES